MDDFLAARASISGSHPAVIAGGEPWTYRELNERAARVCARLAALGVVPGARLGLMAENSPAYVAVVHALARMGAVLVPLNVRLARPELASKAEQAGMDTLIVGGSCREIAAGVVAESRLLDLEGLAGDERGGEAIDASEWGSRRIDPDASWAILFTSGTSGRPKGAVLTAANLRASAEASAYRLGVQAEDRWLLTMPLYHIGGLSILVRSCLYGTTVVLEESFEAERVWEQIEKRRVTLVSMVPTMLERFLDAAGGRVLPAWLRLVLVGGARAPEGLVQRALEAGVPLALTYGLTEASSQVATARPDEVRVKPASVGKALFGTRLRVVRFHTDEDPAMLPSPDSTGGVIEERGRLRIATHGRAGFHNRPGSAGEEPERQIGAAAGEVGEIVVRGPTVMRGYLGEPARKGWFHTGDIGYLDEDGDLFVLQRRSDLILSGGENVYPAEVEAALRAFPGVRDACVTGLPDPTWGQRVAAAVETDGREIAQAALEAFLRQRIAGFKLPRRVIFVKELPRTASGKVIRRDVERMFEVKR